MTDRRYTIPYISVLDALDLSSNEIIMEDRALRLPVMTTNWPDEYPYTPITSVDLAYADNGFYIRFRSRGKGLKAQFSEDGSPVHKDSCVEAFLKFPDAERYFNLEFNCIGTADCGYRVSREDNLPFTHQQYAMIDRVTSERQGMLFERPLGIHEFVVSLRIDYKLFGLSSRVELPDYILANFYKCGDETTVPHFASWMPVDAPHPDFHRPESFRPLYFEKR